jgi:hypothetical protein
MTRITGIMHTDEALSFVFVLKFSEISSVRAIYCKYYDHGKSLPWATRQNRARGSWPVRMLTKICTYFGQSDKSPQIRITTRRQCSLTSTLPV